MTNLIASIVVCLVTNSTDVVDVPPPSYSYGCLVYGCRTDHAQEFRDAARRSKWVVTSCEEVKTVSFELDGQTKHVETRTLLWRTSQAFKLKETWEADGEPQPATPVEVSGVLTNGIFMRIPHPFKFDMY